MESYELLCDILIFSSTDHSSSSQQTIAPYEKHKPTLSNGEFFKLSQSFALFRSPCGPLLFALGVYACFHVRVIAGVGVSYVTNRLLMYVFIGTYIAVKKNETM